MAERQQEEGQGKRRQRRESPPRLQPELKLWGEFERWRSGRIPPVPTVETPAAQQARSTGVVPVPHCHDRADPKHDQELQCSLGGQQPSAVMATPTFANPALAEHNMLRCNKCHLRYWSKWELFEHLHLCHGVPPKDWKVEVNRICVWDLKAAMHGSNVLKNTPHLESALSEHPTEHGRCDRVLDRLLKSEIPHS